VTIDGVDSDAAAARATLFWCFFVPLWRLRALYVDEACIAQLAVVFIASAVGKTFDNKSLMRHRCQDGLLALSMTTAGTQRSQQAASRAFRTDCSLKYSLVGVIDPS
jgi:hypothetical protein